MKTTTRQTNMRKFATMKSWPIGMTLASVPGAFDQVAARQAQAYEKEMGRKPPPPRNAQMAEQFRWPNAKRRKYNRKTIWEVTT